MGIFKKFFCNSCEHDYDLIDKEIKEPPLYRMLNSGLCEIRGSVTQSEMLTKKYVSRVFKCKKCNKIWIDTIQM